MTRWRAVVAPIVARILASVRGAPEREIRAALRAGCPYRAGYIRGVFFNEVRRARGTAPPLFARGIRRKGYAGIAQEPLLLGALPLEADRRSAPRARRKDPSTMPNTPPDRPLLLTAEDLRAHNFGDPRAVEGCPGCDEYGLCQLHADPRPAKPAKKGRKPKG